MNRLLLDDKIPFFFTILIGLLVYQFNHLVSYISDTPTVAYQYRILDKKEEAESITEDLELRIENINRKINFKDLVIDVKYRSTIEDTPTKVYEPQLLAIAPATLLPDSVVSSRHDLVNRYHISHLQPRGLYIARLKVRHHKNIREFPKVYLNSTSTVLFTEGNWEAALVRNQFRINIFLLVLWIVLIVIYFIKLFSHATTKKDAS